MTDRNPAAVALPNLGHVRADERPTPLLADPPPFTLTAETSRASDAHQTPLALQCPSEEK